MLYINTREALGPEAEERARRVCGGEVEAQLSGTPRAYGDGRLSPYEWLRTDRGGIRKADTTGHEWDHTVVGRQSVAWDVAAALIEWEGDASHALLLRKAVREAGEAFSLPVYTFYTLAYLAFRVGQLKTCADIAAGDLPERFRLTRAYRAYAQRLARALRMAG